MLLGLRSWRLEISDPPLLFSYSPPLGCAPVIRVPETIRRLSMQYEGQLPPAVGNEVRRIDVLDVSNNTGISGMIPESYSGLQMFFADGTGLSGSQLPSFVDTASESRYESKYDTVVCGSIEPFPDEGIVAVALDPSYDDFSLCTCDDG